MWPEIFTLNFENGDKAAIILLNTQGKCEDQSDIEGCKKLFAINMMISSVNCYNLLENIKENDLKNFEALNDFGQFSTKETQEKPFQKLLYIVRDWPALDVGYGRYQQQKIDEFVMVDTKKSAEVKGLRNKIESNFEEIHAFLMPHSGDSEPHDNLQQIQSNFIKYANELTTLLFAPENLSIKTINGHKMRAHHLTAYLNEVSKIFRRKTLPSARNVFMVSAEQLCIDGK